MAVTLTFAAEAETVRRLARERDALAVTSGQQIPDLLDALEQGRAVVALMAVATGYVVPKGVEVAFDPECPTEGALRAQCEARDPARRAGPKLYPHQQAMIDAMGDLPDPFTIFFRMGRTRPEVRISETARNKAAPDTDTPEP
ncbi:hypothetical protein [Defluviimonas salinarum]|uniref:Uncharacterized protein n=1 Tax=Defluviimonas salinarum TaxID=2992147 RepID=A0ABT3J5U7_9RHOB|nr:hypothetical protein [Defluviimonas salinarum]MCW3783030.1 hypothetical protein [Defluviimonas salinarum]